MIVKVKEPQPVECKMLRKGQLLYTYLHLAPDPEQTEGLLKSGCTAIAYETVTARGGLPLLAPMSEVAGRMSVQAGAHCLEKAQGGAGILLGGVPGVTAAKVVVIGGGVVGTNAARMAHGHGGQRDHHRPFARSPVAARRAVRRQAQHHLLDRRRDRAVHVINADLRDRRRAGARRRGAEAGDAQDARSRCARARCSSTSPSTRAAASRPATRPRTPIRPT